MTKVSMIVDFSKDASSSQEECPFFQVVVPQDTVLAGEQAAIQLWGPSDQLSGWTLYNWGESLGSGTLKTNSELTWQEQVDVDPNIGQSKQLEYPFSKITKAQALTPLAYIDSANPSPPQIAYRYGADLMSVVRREKGSCVVLEAERDLYGSFIVEVERYSNYLEWYWTVPADRYGSWWFYLYDDLSRPPKRQWALGLPEIASSTAEEKNLLFKCVDYSTEEPIPNTAIYIDGVQKGITDTDGLLYVTGVLEGTHAFKATHDEYLDTDVDGLSNDSIVVRDT